MDSVAGIEKYIRTENELRKKGDYGRNRRVMK